MNGTTRQEGKMGTKDIILFLMVFFHFCYPASLTSLGSNLPSACLQENVGDKEMDEHNCSTRASANGIAHRRNLATGAVGGRGGSGGSDGSGGRSVGSGEEGNGGATTTPNTATGTAVIPLYAAGAANSHHNSHHGAGSCNRSCLGLPTLCAVILVSLTVHVYIILGIENLMKPA